MAATRLIPLHINKGKTIAQCLRLRTDYAKNPEKTEKGELISSYACDPMMLLPPSFVQNQPATIVRQWPDILSTGKLPADSVFSFIVH